MSIALNNPALAPTAPFTSQNLAIHNQQEQDGAQYFFDLAEELSAFEDRLDALRLHLFYLGIQVPEYVLINMARSYDGILPVERFLVENEDYLLHAEMREEVYTTGTEQYDYTQFNEEDRAGWQ